MQDEPQKSTERGKVVRMLETRGTDADATLDATLAGFINYWKKMRRSDGVPRRADIDPRGISQLISNAFIAERIAPGLARMRIAGTHLSDLLGMEVRGMPVSALFNTAHRDVLADHIVRLFDEPAMVHLQIAAKPKYGAALEGAMVLLPLRSDLGDISRALGCLVTRGQLGTAPHRFDVLSTTITPLDMNASDHAAPNVAPSVAGFAETPATFETAREILSSERPYLRVIK